MLRKFVKISNVGLLRDGVPATPANFDAVTLIYAENGRGKSTIANILRAVAQGDVQAVVGGKTIDSPDTPHVNLLCDVGAAMCRWSSGWGMDGNGARNFCVRSDVC